MSTATTTEIMSAGAWATNGAMFADIAKLGWFDGHVLDLSYGLGVFWNDFTPEHLVTNDIDPEKGAHSEDARRPPLTWYSRFDAVVWDPPFKMQGTPGEVMKGRYGIDEARTGKDTMDLVLRGAVGAAECARGGGRILVKCQNQICGGRYVDQVGRISQAMLRAGCKQGPIFYLVSSPRPQPSDRRQVNPRNNVSQLVTFIR